MESVPVSLEVQGGSAGFAKGMGYATSRCRATSYQQTLMQQPHSFLSYVEEENLTLDQIFNCDESGLYFHLFPEKTLAAAYKKSAIGSKNACSNASGSIKLPLQPIGKAK